MNTVYRATAVASPQSFIPPTISYFLKRSSDIIRYKLIAVFLVPINKRICFFFVVEFSSSLGLRLRYSQTCPANNINAMRLRNRRTVKKNQDKDSKRQNVKLYAIAMNKKTDIM